MVSGCCVTARNSEWLKPQPHSDRPPIWASTTAGLDAGSAPYGGSPSAPTLLADFEHAFLHSQWRAWSSESFSSGSAQPGVSVHRTRQIHSACACWGRIKAQRRALAGGRWPVQLGRRRKVWWVCGGRIANAGG